MSLSALTSGQRQTAALSVGLAALLAAGGLPPVLDRDPRPRPPAAAAAVAAPAPEAPPAEVPADPPVAPNLSPDGAAGAEPAIELQVPPATEPGAPFPAVESPSEPPPAPVALGQPSVKPVAPGQPSVGVVPVNAAGEAVAVAGLPAGGTAVALVESPDGGSLRTVLARLDEGGVVTRTLPGRQGTAATAIASGRGTSLLLGYQDGRVDDVDVERGTGRVLGTLPDVPPCVLEAVPVDCQAGAADTRPSVGALVARARGDVLIADRGQAVVWRLAEGAITLWHRDAAYGLNALTGITERPDGEVLLTVREQRDAVSGEARPGALYAFTGTDEGGVGDRSRLVELPSAEDAAGAAVTADGAVVALTGSRQLLVVNDRGVRRTALPAAAGVAAPVALAARDARLRVLLRGASSNALLTVPLP